MRFPDKLDVLAIHARLIAETVWLTTAGGMIEYEIVDECDAIFVPAIVPGTGKVYNRT